MNAQIRKVVRAAAREQWKRFVSFLYTMLCLGDMTVGDEDYTTMWFCGRWILWTPKGTSQHRTFAEVEQACFKVKLTGMGKADREEFNAYCRRNGWKAR